LKTTRTWCAPVVSPCNETSSVPPVTPGRETLRAVRVCVSGVPPMKRPKKFSSSPFSTDAK
jgi:hypothetical protein